MSFRQNSNFKVISHPITAWHIIVGGKGYLNILDRQGNFRAYYLFSAFSSFPISIKEYFTRLSIQRLLRCVIVSPCFVVLTKLYFCYQKAIQFASDTHTIDKINYTCVWYGIQTGNNNHTNRMIAKDDEMNLDKERHLRIINVNGFTLIFLNLTSGFWSELTGIDSAYYDSLFNIFQLAAYNSKWFATKFQQLSAIDFQLQYLRCATEYSLGS